MKLSVIESRVNVREDVFKGTEISWEIMGDGIRVGIPTGYTCYRILSVYFLPLSLSISFSGVTW